MSDPKQTETTMRRSRARKLKVYQGNLDGRHEAVMACYSYKEFYAATRINRDYGMETSNPEQVEQAMSEPGTIFKRHMTLRDAKWIVHRKAAP